MITRRSLLSSCGALGAAAATSLLTGCSGSPTPISRAAFTTSPLPHGHGSATAGAAAARAVTGFTAALYARLAQSQGSSEGNLACSPYSVAMALAMARAGARGNTATQIDEVLGAGPGYDAGMCWLDRTLASRAGRTDRADGSSAEVSLATANAVWGQSGLRWKRLFLDTLAADYGTGMHLADYARHPDAARRRINDWTARQTHGWVEDLLAPGTLDELTRLVLVNALWFQAPWETPFEKDLTRPLPFTRADGRRMRVPTMSQTRSGGDFASGTGWVAARLPYAGAQLALAVVVPTGRATVADLERTFDGAGLGALLGGFRRVSSVEVQLPRWRTRSRASLAPVLGALGMPTAFTDAADFSGMTADERLQIGSVEHQAWIGVDEAGSEAAAATAVVMGVTSAPIAEDPRQVRADRPFLYVIHDVATGVPLFLGRVGDPGHR